MMHTVSVTNLNVFKYFCFLSVDVFLLYFFEVIYVPFICHVWSLKIHTHRQEKDGFRYIIHQASTVCSTITSDHSADTVHTFNSCPSRPGAWQCLVAQTPIAYMSKR